MLRRGAARHREAVIGEDLAGARYMGQNTVEDATAMPVIIHAELEKVTEETARLRHSESERVLDLRPAAMNGHRIGCPLAVRLLVAQEGHEVAGCSKAGAEHRRACRLVPEFVDLEGLKMRAGRKQPDQLPVCKLPAIRWNLG